MAFVIALDACFAPPFISRTRARTRHPDPVHTALRRIRRDHPHCSAERHQRRRAPAGRDDQPAEFLMELGFENVRRFFRVATSFWKQVAFWRGARALPRMEAESVWRSNRFLRPHRRRMEEASQQNPFRKEGERDPGHLIGCSENAPRRRMSRICRQTFPARARESQGKQASSSTERDRSLEADERDDRKRIGRGPAGTGPRFSSSM